MLSIKDLIRLVPTFQVTALEDKSHCPVSSGINLDILSDFSGGKD